MDSKWKKHKHLVGTIKKTARILNLALNRNLNCKKVKSSWKKVHTTQQLNKNEPKTHDTTWCDSNSHIENDSWHS